MVVNARARRKVIDFHSTVGNKKEAILKTLFGAYWARHLSTTWASLFSRHRQILINSWRIERVPNYTQTLNSDKHIHLSLHGDRVFGQVIGAQFPASAVQE